jgi:hypothetical protein
VRKRDTTAIESQPEKAAGVPGSASYNRFGSHLKWRGVTMMEVLRTPEERFMDLPDLATNVSPVQQAIFDTGHKVGDPFRFKIIRKSL